MHLPEKYKDLADLYEKIHQLKMQFNALKLAGNLVMAPIAVASSNDGLQKGLEYLGKALLLGFSMTLAHQKHRFVNSLIGKHKKDEDLEEVYLPKPPRPTP